MNNKQINIAVDNKVNGEIADSPNKGRQRNRHIADKHYETNNKNWYWRIIKKPNGLIYWSQGNTKKFPDVAKKLKWHKVKQC